jgi:hypothetical protein
MRRHDGKELKRREDCTERQMIVWDMADAWIGMHNVRRIWSWGTGIVFCVHGGLGTFDCDRLTRLVLHAHARRVRVELSGASSRYIRVALHARETKGGIGVRHPGLTELAEWAMRKEQVR